ncbi:hypothetical protein WJX73_004060 [Symbiochloris irregularis]|uniref:Uncharacterized protein n=1 Tax=Symbiochloris irregularis TaxID=706552 RepID=A0AAW1PYS0_9CHLO
MFSRTDVAFFCISVGYQEGWIAVSSMLGAFKQLFGPAMFLYLNLAYYLPSIPVLVLQAQFDHRLNQRLGLPTATAIRMTFGLGCTAAIMGLLPFFMWRAYDLLVLVVLLGITSSVVFSSSYQIVSHFPASSNVALTTGFVGGGPLVLLVQLLAEIGPHPSQGQAALLFEFSAFIAILGLVAGGLLISKHWHHLAAMGGGGSKEPLLPWWLRTPGQDAKSGLRAGSKFSTPPVTPPAGHSRTVSLSIDHESSYENLSIEASEAFLEESSMGGSLLSHPHETQTSLSATWRRIWPAAVALFLSVGASMVVAPFFTYVPSSGSTGDLLPQVLFAARTLSDIAGRLLPFIPAIRSKTGLFIAGVLRAALTPGFFWYMNWGEEHGMLNDYVIILAIAVFWAASGHVNACAYVMAAQWAPPGGGDRAGGLMALSFQVSCLVSLLLAAALQHVIFPQPA